MRSGELDRSIVIQARTETLDSYGEPVYTWAKIHADDILPARIAPQRGGERFTAQQTIGKFVTTFRIRYRIDVTVLNRIVYDSRNWDIQDVREIGRREGLEIDATARSEP